MLQHFNIAEILFISPELAWYRQTLRRQNKRGKDVARF